MRRDQPPLKLRHSRLRSDVAFTSDHDHNPLVLDDCPRCNGYRKYDVFTDPDPETGIARQIDLHGCEVCGGSGRASVQVPYFDNAAEPITVRLPANGLLRCPCCGWGFNVRDRAVWTGWRHGRCGQRIRFITSDA